MIDTSTEDCSEFSASVGEVLGAYQPVEKAVLEVGELTTVFGAAAPKASLCAYVISLRNLNVILAIM